MNDDDEEEAALSDTTDTRTEAVASLPAKSAGDDMNKKSIASSSARQNPKSDQPKDYPPEPSTSRD